MAPLLAEPLSPASVVVQRGEQPVELILERDAPAVAQAGDEDGHTEADENVPVSCHSMIYMIYSSLCCVVPLSFRGIKL